MERYLWFTIPLGALSGIEDIRSYITTLILRWSTTSDSLSSRSLLSHIQIHIDESQRVVTVDLGNVLNGTLWEKTEASTLANLVQARVFIDLIPEKYQFEDYLYQIITSFDRPYFGKIPFHKH